MKKRDGRAVKQRDECVRQYLPLEVLVDKMTEHTRRLRYTEKTIVNRRGILNSFVRFVRKSDAKVGFSVEAVERYLTHRGVPTGNGAVNSAQGNVRGVMRQFTEFAMYGEFRRRRYKRPASLPEYWEQLLSEFEQFRRDEWKAAPRSLRRYQSLIRRFMVYLVGRGMESAAAIDAASISGHVSSLPQCCPKTVATVVSAIKSFLRHLCIRGIIDGTILEQVPTIRVHGRSRLPAIWPIESVQSLLDVVDRASPFGKRDYAILLLAARMGMRVGDIRDLTFERMDWEHNCIRLAQAKTGVPLELPLSEEVGQAIIDYLRHGRPTTDDRHIFIRHHAPFEAFGQDNNLYWIITSYRRKAGIKLPRQSKSGLHSLRHTLASRLLEACVPVETIASTLGHLAPNSTRQYLRVDVNELRRAALDTEEVFHE
jgi:integrase